MSAPAPSRSPLPEMVASFEIAIRERVESGTGWPARAEIAGLLQRWGGADRDSAWTATHAMFDRVGRAVSS